VESLRKVLELERAKDFADTAVLGGLDGFLHRLMKEDRPLGGARLRTALGALPAHGYAGLTPSERRRWAERLLSVLADGPNSARAPRA